MEKLSSLEKKDSVNPLCQIMVKPEIAASREKATTILHFNCMLNTRSCKVQITTGLPNCPWKVVHAISDIGVGPNLIRMDAMDES